MRSTLLGCCLLAAASEVAWAAERAPVVLELFTSEGCSSCPAADAVLVEFERSPPLAGVEIIPLGEHVDYWHRLGWRDPFSAPLFSQRQEAYSEVFGPNRVYTPQMVVDGQREFVGDRSLAIRAIQTAAASPKVPLELSLVPRCGDPAELKIEIRRPPSDAAAELMLALTESGLSSRVSQGENAGRTLRHSAAVRRLWSLGVVPPGPKPYRASSPVSLERGWNRGSLRLVAFLQEPKSRRILGAATLPFCGN